MKTFRIFDFGLSINVSVMSKRSRVVFGRFRSGNRKSAIRNPKSLRVSIIVFLIVETVGLAQAQQAVKIPHVGFLSATSASAISARVEGFRRGLHELGYVEGKNIAVEWRYADG